jgi:hypothetical protein
LKCIIVIAPRWPPENTPPNKAHFRVEIVENGDRTYTPLFVESTNREGRMNVLKPHMKTTVETLLDKGISRREIHRKTGINRKTIRRYERLHHLVAAEDNEHSKCPTHQGVAIRARRQSMLLPGNSHISPLFSSHDTKPHQSGDHYILWYLLCFCLVWLTRKK